MRRICSAASENQQQGRQYQGQTDEQNAGKTQGADPRGGGSLNRSLCRFRSFLRGGFFLFRGGFLLCGDSFFFRPCGLLFRFGKIRPVRGRILFREDLFGFRGGRFLRKDGLRLRQGLQPRRGILRSARGAGRLNAVRIKGHVRRGRHGVPGARVRLRGGRQRFLPQGSGYGNRSRGERNDILPGPGKLLLRNQGGDLRQGFGADPNILQTGGIPPQQRAAQQECKNGGRAYGTLPGPAPSGGNPGGNGAGGGNGIPGRGSGPRLRADGLAPSLPEAFRHLGDLRRHLIQLRLKGKVSPVSIRIVNFPIRHSLPLLSFLCSEDPRDPCVPSLLWTRGEEESSSRRRMNSLRRLRARLTRLLTVPSVTERSRAASS